MPRYIYQCRKCLEILEEDRLIKDRDQMPDKHNCTEGCDWHRPPVAPTVLRASYLDGTKRKGFEDGKKIAELEVKRAQARPEERAAIDKEITAREKIK